MKRLVIHGQRESLDSPSATPDFPSSLKNLVTLKHRAKVQRARAGHPPLEIDDLNPDDLVQLELDQGVKLWVRADDLEQDFGLTPTRGPAGDELELPQALPLGSVSRGMVGTWVIKGLKIFGLDPIGATTEFIKDKVEGLLKPGPGLYRWEGNTSSDYIRIKSLEKEKTDTPWLVFIHGTAALYAEIIARNMRNRSDLESIENFDLKLNLTALLHDIGKIGVSDFILAKPARLTDDEYKQVRRYPVVGASILKPLKVFREVREAVIAHREHWNGEGYPNGLSGEDIPILARIISVADALDAIISKRPYKEEKNPAYALEEIMQFSGSHFDPNVVDALSCAYHEGKILAQQ